MESIGKAKRFHQRYVRHCGVATIREAKVGVLEVNRTEVMPVRHIELFRELGDLISVLGEGIVPDKKRREVIDKVYELAFEAIPVETGMMAFSVRPGNEMTDPYLYVRESVLMVQVRRFLFVKCDDKAKAAEIRSSLDRVDYYSSGTGRYFEGQVPGDEIDVAIGELVRRRGNWHRLLKTRTGFEFFLAGKPDRELIRQVMKLLTDEGYVLLV